MVPTVLDFTMMPVSGLTTFVSVFTYLGSSWKIEVINDTTLRFFGEVSMSLAEGTGSHGAWSFVFTEPGTTKIDAFSTDKVPTLAA